MSTGPVGPASARSITRMCSGSFSAPLVCGSAWRQAMPVISSKAVQLVSLEIASCICFRQLRVWLLLPCNSTDAPRLCRGRSIECIMANSVQSIMFSGRRKSSSHNCKVASITAADCVPGLIIGLSWYLHQTPCRYGWGPALLTAVSVDPT